MYCVLKIDHFNQPKYLTLAGHWTKQVKEAWQFEAWTSAAVAAEKCGGDVINYPMPWIEPQVAHTGNACVPLLSAILGVVLLASIMLSPIVKAVGHFSSPERWSERIAHD